MQTLVKDGSCDTSYELPGKVRFRINIFSQGENYSTILRKLDDRVPSCGELNLPKVFFVNPRGEKRARLIRRRDRNRKNHIACSRLKRDKREATGSRNNPRRPRGIQTSAQEGNLQSAGTWR